MIRDLKILALAICAILIAVTALARSEGIYNPSSNSIGDYQGIDSKSTSGGGAPCTSTGILNLSNVCNDIYFIGVLK